MKIYRLLEYPLEEDVLFVNIGISDRSESNTGNKIYYPKLIVPDNLTNKPDDFCYDMFFIGTSDAYIIFDKYINVVDMHNFDRYIIYRTIKPKNFICRNRIKYKYKSTFLIIEGVCIELMKFTNNKIVNNIEIRVFDYCDARGLFNNRRANDYIITEFNNIQQLPLIT